MGTKISALTETGSAPTGAYYPLEYDNANYKISTETLRGSLGGKYVADWAQSHGGVAVANTATLPITHNLGTTNVIVQVFVNSSASDTNAQTLLNGVQSGTASVYGAVVTNITATEVTLQLGYAGYIDVSSGGGATQISFTTGPAFIKVVVLSAGTGGTAQKFSDSAAQSAPSTVDYKIGDLQGEDQVFISASIRHSLVTDPWQISATYGRSDAAGTRVLTATVFGRASAPGETQSYTVLEGGSAVSFWGGVGVNHTMKFKAVGDEVFVELFCATSYPATIYWSYTASAGAGGGGGGTVFYKGGSNSTETILTQSVDTTIQAVSLTGAFATNSEVRWTMNIGVGVDSYLSSVVGQLVFLKPQGESVFYLISANQPKSAATGSFVWGATAFVTTTYGAGESFSFGTDYIINNVSNLSMRFTKNDDDTMTVSIKKESANNSYYWGWQIFAERLS